MVRKTNKFDRPIARRVWLACRILIICASGSSSATLACGQSGSGTLPYLDASIGQYGAEVRSGPGSSHYATDQLAIGSGVRIYRLDPGGWCAVAPPRNSFSIVAAGQIDQQSVSQGVVNAEGTRAWVGTLLGNADDPMYQVKLDSGEQVTILGLIGSTDEANSGWFQIAPPNGEFRWVHVDDLSDSSRAMLLSSAMAREFGGQASRIESSQVENHQSGTVPASPANFESSIPTRPEPQAGNQQHISPTPAAQSGWQPARNSMQQILASNTGGLAANASEPGISVAGNTGIPTRPIGSVPANQTPNSGNTFSQVQTGPTTATAGGLLGSAELESLELALSIEMTKPPEQWDFSSMQTRALRGRQNSRDPQLRMDYDKYLAKLTQFENVANRNSGISGQPAQNPRLGQQFPTAHQFGNGQLGNGQSVSRQTSDLQSNSPQVSGLYDAFGTLEELVRDGGMSPPTYVLRDDRGNITHHIQAAAGMNLHRYLKQRIGIVGQRGYNQSLQLNHVTASRIIELDKLRR